MTYDFGFDNGESEELIILGWINYLEHSFDLVMIMEHFDESLILLKVWIQLKTIKGYPNQVKSIFTYSNPPNLLKSSQIH